jgi:hypothetical protein
MRKLQNTKQSTKANTTISALQDAKNPSKQTPKNTSVETHQVTTAIAVMTTAKPLRFSLQRSSFCFFTLFRNNQGKLIVQIFKKIKFKKVISVLFS